MLASPGGSRRPPPPPRPARRSMLPHPDRCKGARHRRRTALTRPRRADARGRCDGYLHRWSNTSLDPSPPGDDLAAPLLSRAWCGRRASPIVSGSVSTDDELCPHASLGVTGHGADHVAGAGCRGREADGHRIPQVPFGRRDGHDERPWRRDPSCHHRHARVRRCGGRELVAVGELPAMASWRKGILEIDGSIRDETGHGKGTLQGVYER